jgi:hypothetical protein
MITRRMACAMATTSHNGLERRGGFTTAQGAARVVPASEQGARLRVHPQELGIAARLRQRLVGQRQLRARESLSWARRCKCYGPCVPVGTQR